MIPERCEIRRAPEPGAQRQQKTILKRLLERDDLIVVAGGSPGCLRSLYRQARSVGKLGQLMLCPLTRVEYASGRYLAKIQSCLQRAVDTPGVRAVVVYASCVDFLMNSDYSPVAARLRNPQNVRVEVLFRGPLARRTVPVSARTQEILDTLPPQTGRVDCGAPLPPPAPDFDGLNAVLDDWGGERLLLSSGGCTGCLTRTGEQSPPLFSRMDDVLLSMGCEGALTQAIAAAHTGEPELFLLQATVPSFLAVDVPAVERGLRARNVPARFVRSDGWSPAPAALARFFLACGQAARWERPAEGERPRVGILGYSYLANGRKELLAPGIALLRRAGFAVEFWTPDSPASSVHWVVSSDGLPLARWAEEAFGIPFAAGIPIGARQEAAWLSRFTGQANAEPAAAGAPAAADGTVLLTGEPLLVERLAAYFDERMPRARVQKALYRPAYPEAQYGAPGWRFFGDGDELRQLARGAAIFVGDPLLCEQLSAPCAIPVPHPLISGDLFAGLEYRCFGTAGAEYLDAFLRNAERK